jgi:predicted oxidoreductase (fatty acid repression mutant protein)
MAFSLVPLSLSVAAEQRRSHRALEAKSPVPDRVVIELAHHAILHIPSAHNNQAARMTILFGDDHRKLWTIISKTLLNKIGPERFEGHTEQRMAAFSNSYGTILFWDDVAVANDMNEISSSMHKEQIDEWVQQSQGMHQYYVWLALDALGLGANIQHYNPIIDEEVQQTWNVPSTWKLKGQMVFGMVKEGSVLPEKKQKLSVDETVQVFGARM